MGAWDFGAAADTMAASAYVLESRDNMILLLDSLDISLPPGLEERYETAEIEDLARLSLVASEYEDTAVGITEARAAIDADRNIIEEVGAWFSDVEVDYDSAVASFEGSDRMGANEDTERVITQVDGYQRQGIIRIAAAAFLLFLVLLSGVLLYVWFKSDRAGPGLTGETAGPRNQIGSNQADMGLPSTHPPLPPVLTPSAPGQPGPY